MAIPNCMDRLAAQNAKAGALLRTAMALLCCVTAVALRPERLFHIQHRIVLLHVRVKVLD